MGCGAEELGRRLRGQKNPWKSKYSQEVFRDETERSQRKKDKQDGGLQPKHLTELP